MRIRLLLGVLTIVLVTGCLLAQQDAYVPQVANGTYAGGSMRTTFILFNPTALFDLVTMRLTDDTGQPMVVTIPGRGTAAEFGGIFVAAGQTIILQTDGTGNLKVGAAVVERATGGTQVAAIFTLYDATQHFVTEAGVGASELLSNFVIPVDATGQFNTGVALFNPGAADATVIFLLLKADGTQASRSAYSNAGRRRTPGPLCGWSRQSVPNHKQLPGFAVYYEYGTDIGHHASPERLASVQHHAPGRS